MIDGQPVVLTNEDLLIDTVQKQGFYAVADNGVTVVLDTVLTDALIEEGYVRELISKIQTMRKDAGFNVMDHIRVTCSENAVLNAVIERNIVEISNDVLADSLFTAPCEGFIKDWDINGEKLTIGIVQTAN